MEKWDGKDRRSVRTLERRIERALVRFRVLSILVMVFSGWLMTVSFNWVIAIPHEQLGMHHAGLIAAVFTPITAIFKFAFDYALDGQIDESR